MSVDNSKALTKTATLYVAMLDRKFMLRAWQWISACAVWGALRALINSWMHVHAMELDYTDLLVSFYFLLNGIICNFNWEPFWLHICWSRKLRNLNWGRWEISSNITVRFPSGSYFHLIYGCVSLTRTGNYWIHEFDWLKSELKAI